MKVFLLVLLVSCVLGAPSKDEIHSLPGWNGPLPTRQWSGLVDIGVPPSGVGRMLMHYWFMESEIGHDAPVIMWYNGGPGASSLYGLLVELGPLWLNDLSYDAEYNSTGIPQFVRNPWAWTKIGHLLVVDNPPPVGFSYCTQFGPAGNGTSCGPWNDTAVATANAEFIVQWFNLFPEFKKNPFFITGESYAGVYVPIITRALLSRPESRSINLQGIATGDGCLGTNVLCGAGNLGLGAPWWDVVFFYGHGQLSNDFYDELLTVCTVAELKNATQSPKCAAMVTKMYQVIGGFYEYNLLDYCPDNLFRRRRSVSNPVYNFPGVGYPCSGNAMTQWLTLPDARRALNVPVNSFFFNADNGNDFVYVLTEPNVMTYYIELLQKTKIRALIYNGDEDPSLSSFRTQAAWFPFLREQNVSVTDEWRPWTIDGKQDVRGYVQEWANNRLAYLTIRGAGHMTPLFRSEASFNFMRAFVLNSGYPGYVPPPGGGGGAAGGHRPHRNKW